MNRLPRNFAVVHDEGVGGIDDEKIRRTVQLRALDGDGPGNAAHPGGDVAGQLRRQRFLQSDVADGKPPARLLNSHLVPERALAFPVQRRNCSVYSAQ